MKISPTSKQDKLTGNELVYGNNFRNYLKSSDFLT
jgi:hypothetical protein